MSNFDIEQKYYNDLISERNHDISSNKFESSLIETALGRMIAIADSESLYLLEFMNRVKLPNQIRKLQRASKSSINHSNNNPIIKLASSELAAYYRGELKEFTIPTTFLGTEFQKNIWQKLMLIPFGKIVSYMDHAAAVAAPQSYRATANAIGSNHLAIIVPCHRVIRTSGHLGGYAAGIDVKKTLLEHERKNR